MTAGRAALGAALALLGLAAAGPTTRELVTEGNALYRRAAEQDGEKRRALYGEAAARYAQAASLVQNAYALYNLGNARYRAGEVGRAIAAYRRAELLMPRHGPLRRNLALARDSAPGGATVPRPHPAAAAFFFWHYALSLAEVEGLASACFLLSMAALSLRLFLEGRWRLRLRSVAIALGVLAFVFVLSSVAKLTSSELDGAVVVVREAGMRSEPAGRAVELYVLREGAEVRVLKHTGHWIRVESSPGMRGWVESQALEVLAEPPAVQPGRT